MVHSYVDLIVKILQIMGGGGYGHFKFKWTFQILKNLLDVDK